jgi:hypothetical protein
VNIFDRNDEDFATLRFPSEDIPDPPAVERFVGAIDALVDRELTSDAVEARLERVRRDAESTVGTRDEQDYDSLNWYGLHGKELAEYGYHIMQMWLRVVVVWTRANLAVGERQVDLRDDDIDELAKETVARGIHSLCDQERRSGLLQWADTTEVRTELLLQCARQLPHAYRSAVDPLEEGLAEHSAGAFLVHCLQHCVTERRDHTAHLLQSWGYSRKESKEMVSMTLSVLNLATRRYAALANSQSTAHGYSNLAVER